MFFLSYLLLGTVVACSLLGARPSVLRGMFIYLWPCQSKVVIKALGLHWGHTVKTFGDNKSNFPPFPLFPYSLLSVIFSDSCSTAILPFLAMGVYASCASLATVYKPTLDHGVPNEYWPEVWLAIWTLLSYVALAVPGSLPCVGKEHIKSTTEVMCW